MKAAYLFRDQLANLGYSTIESDYIFSDVFAATQRDRMVSLAAFTQSPPSYRNAALAVVEMEQGHEFAEDYRALGAPLLFVVQGDEVAVWQVRGEGRPTILRRTPLASIATLFSENLNAWSPQRIHGAKSFALMDQSYQLDFVDLGLLPAIEGVLHTKLDRLLTETLAEAVRLRVVRPGEQVDDRLVFRTVFRLLAAKVLEDREHTIANTWNASDIDSVLKGISQYYRLPELPGEAGSFRNTAFDAAWAKLRGGINFQNISSDILAFVYENTLVTAETREHFGTHSTPRAVAEYMVRRLNFASQDPLSAKVYEPFAGSGVFMVAALGQLRDVLPVEMSAIERHHALVNRIMGDEIDPFATEVAMLSLILADYPNENGWAVSQVDLLENYAIRERAQGATIVLCNPPFEAFNTQERLRYPEAFARSPFKPIAALEAVLHASPKAIGFVLPEPFIAGKQYANQRKRVEAQFRNIEVVALPDRVFKASVIRSSLLIASEPRERNHTDTLLRSTVVAPRDRERFLARGEVTETRTQVRPFTTASGVLWIEELADVWAYLSSCPKFENLAEVHKGIQWKDQVAAVSSEPKDGFLPGIHRANSVYAFTLGEGKFLDARPISVAPRTAALKRPWHLPKLLTNAARLSRGPWCFAAAIDRNGLLASQQLLGVWPLPDAPPLETLCALLNSPVGVAYIATHSPPDRIRAGVVRNVPLPSKIPTALEGAVERYVALLNDRGPLLDTERATRALHEIDAVVLKAYDLPPRLERRVLDHFRGERRPATHDWAPWFPENFRPFIPLHEYLSDDYQKATRPWIQEVFEPLPANEAAGLRKYMD